MNPMIAQIKSLPDMVRQIVPDYLDKIQNTLSQRFCQSFDHLYLMGCGDSHHAALASQLAFRLLSGVVTQALTAMQFSRYTAELLLDPARCLVIGISVSGEVARTVEGLLLARKMDTKTLAVTANPHSRIGRAADWVIDSTQPPFSDPEGMVIPGIRSYVSNQIALNLLAIYLAEFRARIPRKVVQTLIQQLVDLGDAIEKTIELNEEKTKELARFWSPQEEYIFLGSGPAYGGALFSAAKILEASGDVATGQDLEEWAHLQYFAKKVTTPTFIISAGDRDLSRAVEIATAAQAIGRHVAVIVPESKLSAFPKGVIQLPLADGIPEVFQAAVSMLPGSMLAAYRAEQIGEPYFRNFGGGREKEGGGGISRIRTSETKGLECLRKV